MDPLRLSIAAAPRTKKTHNRTCEIGARCPVCHRGARTIVKPSEAYEDFEAAVAPSLQRWVQARTTAREECEPCKGTGKKNHKKCPACIASGIRGVLVEVPVIVEAVFYRDVARGDLMGYHQALGDVLQMGGVIRNDELIKGWPMPSDGGLPLRKDAARPRIEIVVREVAAVQQLALEVA